MVQKSDYLTAHPEGSEVGGKVRGGGEFTQRDTETSEISDKNE